MGPAEAEPWRRCQSTRVEETAEAAQRFVRAGRPRSRVVFIPCRRDTKVTKLQKHSGAAPN